MVTSRTNFKGGLLLGSQGEKSRKSITIASNLSQLFSSEENEENCTFKFEKNDLFSLPHVCQRQLFLTRRHIILLLRDLNSNCIDTALFFVGIVLVRSRDWVVD